MSVVVDGVRSSDRPVGSGVPQGSVLGPLLFLLYVNSIAEDASSFWVAFADDFKLGVAHRRGESGEVDRHQLQRDLDRLSATSKSWNLKLNREKCVVMRFGGGAGVGEMGPTYKIEGVELRVVSSYRDLGVIVDHSFTFMVMLGWW